MRTQAESGKPVYIVSFMSPKAYVARHADTGMKIVPGTRTYQVIDFDDSTLRFSSFALDDDSPMDSITITRQ